MILMVTGGRYYGLIRAGKPETLAWAERDWLIGQLDGFHRAKPITGLIHGECPFGGADLLADMWARCRGVPVNPMPVNLAVDGPWPGAGPNRNGRMIVKRPDYLIAFDGNAGTANAVKQAKAVGIQVVDLRS